MSAPTARLVDRSGRPRSWRRRPGAVLGYGAFLLAFPALVAVSLHARYARTQRAAAVRELAPLPGMDAATWRLLGYTAGGGSFLQHPREKPPGRVRIGCFGDSFTFGQEVNEGQDYPALLEQALHENGRPQAEVLNFGMPWHGFHQNYLLWEQVGRRFDLDYVLLGPAGFQPERDTTFDHTQGAYAGYLHARYVLDGDGVRLIEVAGTTFQERLEQYNRLVPLLRYLRYDRRPPAVLRALVPAGSELPNPFYYHREPARAEAFQTYRRLLAAMARQAPDRQVILGHVDPEVAAMAASVVSPNLVAHAVVVPRKFPYLAAQGHYSALGNALIAAQFVQTLTASGKTMALVTTADIDRPPAGVRGDLRSYASVSVALDGSRVGGFAEANRAGWIDRGLLARLQSPAILGLEPSEGSAVDACYVPVPFPLEPGMPLELRMGARSSTLGELRLLSSDAAIGTVTVPARSVGCSIEAGFAIDLPGQGLPPRGDVEVTLAGQVLLRGTLHGDALRVRPDGMQLLVVRAGAGPFPALSSLPQSGTVWLTAQPTSGTPVRVALAHWAQSEVPSPARPAHGPLASPGPLRGGTPVP